MGTKNIIFIFLFTFFFTCSFSQGRDNLEIRNSISTRIINLELPKILDLLDYYKSDQTELLTLEILKIGDYRRETFPRSIYFTKYKYSLPNLIVEGDIQIGKKLDFNDPKFPLKSVFFQIILSRNNLYDLIIELSNSNRFSLRSNETVNEGIKKVFEFRDTLNLKSFLVETFDGDKKCSVTFQINYPSK